MTDAEQQVFAKTHNDNLELSKKIKELRQENDRLIQEIVLLTRVETNIRRFETAIKRIDALEAEIKELQEKVE